MRTSLAEAPALLFVMAASALLSSAGLVAAQTNAPTAIAVINLQRTVEGTAEFRQASELWTARMREQTAGISAKQEEIRQAEAGLAGAQGAPPGAGQDALQARVARLRSEYERMSADVEQDLNALRDRLLLPISAKVDAAIRRYAEANGLELIFDTANPNSAIVVGSSTFDITDAVIKSIETDSTPNAIP